MNKMQAQELVRRYFEVKQAAGSDVFSVPASLDEAMSLLTSEEVDAIEDDVNSKGSVK